MTFLKTPWAVDGPHIPAAVARVATYAAMGSAQGIVQAGDMKVKPRATPSGGVLIGGGNAVINNSSDYEQAYVVQNNGDHDVAVGSTGGTGRSDLVVARIHDPAYAPWTPPAPATEDTYIYTEPFVIAGVPGSTKTAASLGLSYPAIELARIDIPASTVNITSGMIVDLRTVARPRSVEAINYLTANSTDPLNPTAGTYEEWPNAIHFSVDIPTWATKAYCFGFVEGARLNSAGIGSLRLGFSDGSGATQNTQINETGTVTGTPRRSYNVGGVIDITSGMRGTSKVIRMEGTIATSGDSGFLTTDTRTTGLIRVLFVELPF